jgi:hypothetical protein
MKLARALAVYLSLGLIFLAILLAGLALSIDLSQFRYAVF